VTSPITPTISSSAVNIRNHWPRPIAPKTDRVENLNQQWYADQLGNRGRKIRRSGR